MISDYIADLHLFLLFFFHLRLFSAKNFHLNQTRFQPKSWLWKCHLWTHLRKKKLGPQHQNHQVRGIKPSPPPPPLFRDTHTHTHFFFQIPAALVYYNFNMICLIFLCFIILDLPATRGSQALSAYQTKALVRLTTPLHYLLQRSKTIFLMSFQALQAAQTFKSFSRWI